MTPTGKPPTSPARRPARGRLRATAAMATALAVLTVAAGAALADQVRNDVVVGGNDTITLTGATGSTVVKYWIHANNDCDAADGSPAQVTVNVPGGVTKSPTAALTFTSCGEANAQSVTLTSGTVGAHGINVVIADSAGSYQNQANFVLQVVRRNTAPAVTVTGVAAGASYEKGSVPAALCQVSDPEDGARTFAATVGAVTGPLASYGLGNQTASCTATDAGGLSGSDSKTYAVVDTTAPQLSLPGDVTEEATGPGGASVSFAATATDAVDPAPVVACAPVSGSTFALGTRPVSCSATDAAGNRAEGVFSVVVQDTTRPDLTVPADLVREATGPGGAAVTFSASATDTVDGALAPACTPPSGSTFALGSTPVNCTVTDGAGNAASAGFNVAVLDTTRPVLGLPVGITVEATSSAGAVATFSPSGTDVVDGSVSVTCDRPSGSTFDLGTTSVSCSATDVAGNTATGHFVVTVVDTTPPALQLPDDIVREATKPQGADVAFAASAADVVDGNVAVTCTPAGGGTFAIAATTVSCQATDTSGNTATGGFTVTVRDTTAPSMTGVPADRIVEAASAAGATVTFTLPSAADVVDGARTVSCTPGSGSVFPIATTTVTCSAADTRANSVQRTFTVTVADTTPPTVSVPADITEEATSGAGAEVTWTGVSATDAVDGPVTATCDRQSGQTFELGATVVTCSATDSAQNTGEAAFTVVVRDTRAPEVTVPADVTAEATGPNGASVSWSGVSAEDAVDGRNLRTECLPASGSTFALGTATVTCTAADKARNVGEAAFTVTVQDTTAPALTVPADLVREATSAAGAAVAYSATATDAVDQSVTVDCGGTPSGHTFPLGSPTTVTCTATDDIGNVSTRSFTVTVVDTTAPAVTVPAPATVEATGAAGAVHEYDASAADLVDGAVTPQCTPPSGSTFAITTTTVTCTAVDGHGNSQARTFTVKVQDTTAPVLNLPGNLAVGATSAAGAPVTYAATASDLVDGNVVPTCSPASGSTFRPGATTVKCSALDAAGNRSADGPFVVTVSFGHTGFLPPVDGNKVLNLMKAGSTAPVKWQVPNGSGGFIGDLGIVSRTESGVAACTAGAALDELELYSTGHTALRYDATANQFVYNWQSPKAAGKCYVVRITLTDGSVLSAVFQLR